MTAKMPLQNFKIWTTGWGNSNIICSQSYLCGYDFFFTICISHCKYCIKNHKNIMESNIPSLKQSLHIFKILVHGCQGSGLIFNFPISISDFKVKFSQILLVILPALMGTYHTALYPTIMLIASQCPCSLLVNNELGYFVRFWHIDILFW